VYLIVFRRPSRGSARARPGGQAKVFRAEDGPAGAEEIT
jgi:hypothetical protein